MDLDIYETTNRAGEYYLDVVAWLGGICLRIRFFGETYKITIKRRII